MTYKYINRKNGNITLFSNELSSGINTDLDGKIYNFIDLTSYVIDPDSGDFFILSSVLVPWTPAEINTTAWYDASDASTITESGGLVSQLSDKSGNSNHATQGIGISQPVTGTRTLNGLNTIDFDGRDDFIHYIGTFGSTISSMFIVMESDRTINNVSTSQILMSGLGASRTEKAIQSGVGFGSTTGALVDEVIAIYDEDTPNSFTDRQGISSSQVPSIASGTAHIYSYVLTSNWFMGYDGSDDLRDLTNGARNALDFDTDTIGMTIGGEFLSGLGEVIKSPFNGKVAEFIMINSALSTSDRQKLEGYLAWKWGLVSNLPSNHPYKDGAPTI